jgi:DNA-binding HxlR family transcriptional regulator
MKSYDEYCSVAKSLDVVGDRWTLLVVRELLLEGPCRYTDIRNGLPGIASNLLADRLRKLEAAGVVEREDAPPPIATALFRLTPRGEELRPVLDGLMRWGLPLMVEEGPEDVVRSHWIASALGVVLGERRPGRSPLTLELRIGDRPILIEARDEKFTVRVGSVEKADGILTGSPPAVLGLIFGPLDLADAQSRGAGYRGDPAILEALAAS